MNLAPASLPKHGSGFDLAIALAALAASRHLPADGLAEVAHLGELALDGGLRRPAGLLACAAAAKSLGFRSVMVPEACGAEAALVPDIEVIAVPDLASAVAWYRGDRDRGNIVRCSPQAVGESVPHHPGTAVDMADVVGQPEAVEAMVIAAAGRHHVSLLGPPGAGKTLLATRLPTLLPALADSAALEASSIAALGGSALTELVRRPPFESPHHTASAASIIGGGQGIEVRPGAITRACHGVLFLDEAPEFPRTVLDALRQPLETGRIEIHRSRVRTTLPARVQLVLASNPCPCGHAGSPDTAVRCRCTPRVRMSYQQRISGPLADRIDLRLTLQRVSRVLLEEPHEPPQSSARLQSRVAGARAHAADRWAGTPWTVNAEVPGNWMRSPRLRLPRADTAVLDRALAQGALTLRGYDRALRVAWTVSDLAGRDRPRRSEVAQALLLRGGDLA